MTSISGRTLYEILKGRVPDPFVEVEGKVYLRWDRVTIERRSAVFGYQGHDLASIPLSSQILDTVVLTGNGLIEVTP